MQQAIDRGGKRTRLTSTALAACEGNEDGFWAFASCCEARWRTTRNAVPEKQGRRAAGRKQNEAPGCASPPSSQGGRGETGRWTEKH